MNIINKIKKNIDKSGKISYHLGESDWFGIISNAQAEEGLNNGSYELIDESEGESTSYKTFSLDNILQSENMSCH